VSRVWAQRSERRRARERGVDVLRGDHHIRAQSVLLSELVQGYVSSLRELFESVGVGEDGVRVRRERWNRCSEERCSDETERGILYVYARASRGEIEQTVFVLVFLDQSISTLKTEKGTYGRRRARVFLPESVEFGGELGEFDLKGCLFGGFGFHERLELFNLLLRRRGLPTAS